MARSWSIEINLFWHAKRYIPIIGQFFPRQCLGLQISAPDLCSRVWSPDHGQYIIWTVYYIYINIYIYIFFYIYICIYVYIYMIRGWVREYFWWTSNFPMHQKESRKKLWYLTNFICFFLIISKKNFFSHFRTHLADFKTYFVGCC